MGAGLVTAAIPGRPARLGTLFRRCIGGRLPGLEGSREHFPKTTAGLAAQWTCAGGQGFEPRLPGPEPGVLPLHHPPRAGPCYQRCSRRVSTKGKLPGPPNGLGSSRPEAARLCLVQNFHSAPAAKSRNASDPSEAMTLFRLMRILFDPLPDPAVPPPS